MLREKVEGGLADMLATFGLDQSVDRVVGVLACRIELLIGVKHGLQRAVFDPRDVADRIVGVAQSLNRGGMLENFRRQSAFGSCARGLQMDEAEGLLVIFIRRLQTVRVATNRALALRVVVDAGDKRGPERLAVLCCAAQVDVNRL